MRDAAAAVSWHGTRAAGQRALHAPWGFYNRHGLPRWFLASKSPLFDLEGKVMGLAGLMSMISTPEHQRTHFQELERVIEFLERSFVDEVSVKRLAEIAGISVAHLNRRFRQLLRLSPMEYVHSLRIHEAKRLLAATDQNIGRICTSARPTGRIARRRCNGNCCGSLLPATGC